MRNETRKITEGALIVALFGVLLIANRYSGGLLAGYFSFLFPLPIVLFSAKYGFKEALIPYCAILILTFLIAQPTTLFMVGSGCLTGMAYGWGVFKRKSNGVLIAITIAFTILVYFITSVLLADLFGFSLADDMKMMEGIFVSMGLSEKDTKSYMEMIPVIYPTALVLGAFLEGVLVHMISQLVLKALRYLVNKMKTLFEMRAPKWLGYVFLFLSVLPVLVRNFNVHQLITDICYNLNSVALIAFMANGFITVVWLIRVIGKKSHILIFYVALFAFFPLMLPLLIFAGALDMCAGFREKIVKRSTNAGED